MKLLKKIGFIITMFGFFSFVLISYMTKAIVKVDIICFLIMLIGCALQVFPQYKVVKESRDFNAQSIKYFFGIIMGIVIFLGILVWLIKDFYFS